jgi:tetratricopeptide (TPR) repeat protein
VREGERFLALFPDSEFREKTLELEFEAFQEHEDYAAARRIARRILVLNRWDATVLASLANLIVNQNDASSFSEAQEYARRAVQSVEATERPAGMETPEFIRWKYSVLSSAYSAEGILALRRNEATLAIKKLHEAIELRPAASGVDFLRLGEALRLTNDRDAARDAFARAQALGPAPVTEAAKRLESQADGEQNDSALRHFQTARSLEKNGDLVHAAQEYEQAVQLAPALAEAFHNLGLTYYRLQNYKRSKECLERAAQLRPGLAGGELFLGLTEFRLGNFTESALHLTQALRAEPRNREAYLALIRDQSALGRLSLEIAASALRLFPTDGEMNNAIGRACLERIREIARDVNELGPQSPSFWWLSLRRAEERQDAEAIKRWTAKVSNSGRPSAILEFDSVTSMLNEAFGSVLANSPDSAAAHSVKGYLHEARGDMVAALTEYRNAGDHFAAGRLLAQNVQLSEAELEFKKAIETDPENFRAGADLGKLYLQENAANKALPLLLSLVRKYPADAELWSDLGKAQNGVGDSESAVRSFKQALVNDSSMKRVHYQLAMLYRKMGQENLAREELQAFEQSASASR